jgi:hypothetical protein
MLQSVLGWMTQVAVTVAAAVLLLNQVFGA